MNPTAYLTTQLEDTQYKATWDSMTAWVGVDPARFEALMACYFHEDMRIRQQAAQVVGRLGAEHEALLRPYLPRMVAELADPPHPALPRNVLRLLQTHPIPPELEMALMECCFAFLENSQQPAAVRVFAMTVLARLVRPYPELQRELRLILAAHFDQGPAGFRSRARKILAALPPFDH